MKNYLNYWQGDDTEPARFWISDDDTIHDVNLGEFLDAVIRGVPAATPTEGLLDTLNDGALLGSLMDTHKWTESELQAAAEVIHHALTEEVDE